MVEKKITTKVRVYSYNELTEEQKNLVDMAREATTHSYSPYSNFKVGAALKLDNGEVFIGANQENAAFAGICGERAALYAAGAKFPGVPVKSVAQVGCHHFFHQGRVCRGTHCTLRRLPPGLPRV